MLKHISFCGLALLLAVCGRGIARAEINIAPSLEWVTCSAEAIVVGTIGEVKESRGPGEVVYENCLVQIKHVLKGNLTGRQVSFTHRRVGEIQTMQPLVKAKASVLIFLAKSKDHGSERHFDGKWVPTSLGSRYAIVDLAKPAGIYSKSMKIVTDKAEVLHTVGLWAMSPVKRSHKLEVPGDSPLFEELYAGSACFLIVPTE